MTSACWMRMFAHARGEGLDDWPTIPAAELVSGAPVQFGRHYFKAPKLGLNVGMSSSTAFERKAKQQEFDEFGLLLDGSATITEVGGRITEVATGEAYVIPRGAECAWKQAGRVRKIFVTYAGARQPAKTGSDQVVKLDLGARLEPCAGPERSVLNGPEPRCAEHVSYTDSGGQFSVGLWSATPYDRKVTPFPRYELMHFLEGQVDLLGDGNEAQSFQARETVFVPKGAPLGWRSHRDVKKIFVILSGEG